tara:strand:- start:108 stop:341 length:234 start_codon:yes stop_codon:yes gene_type:complete
VLHRLDLEAIALLEAVTSPAVIVVVEEEVVVDTIIAMATWDMVVKMPGILNAPIPSNVTNVCVQTLRFNLHSKIILP